MVKKLLAFWRHWGISITLFYVWIDRTNEPDGDDLFEWLSFGFEVGAINIDKKYNPIELALLKFHYTGHKDVIEPNECNKYTSKRTSIGQYFGWDILCLRGLYFAILNLRQEYLYKKGRANSPFIGVDD